MASYRKLDTDFLNKLCEHYSLGDFIKVNNIAEGSRNSNYKITTSLGSYLFTLFERESEKMRAKHVLPFLNELTAVYKEAVGPCASINQKFIYCGNMNGENIIGALFPYIEHIKHAEHTKEYIYNAGALLAKLHNCSQKKVLTDAYKKLGLCNIYNQKKLDDIRLKIITHSELTEKELLPVPEAVQNISEPDLPRGLCHLDFFPDNLLVTEHHFAVIDWFMMGEENFIYDIAIALCAWGFDDIGQKKEKRYEAFYQGYNSMRSLTKSELEALPMYMQKAAYRFYLTRLEDKLFPRFSNAPILPPEKFERIYKMYATN